MNPDDPGEPVISEQWQRAIAAVSAYLKMTRPKESEAALGQEQESIVAVLRDLAQSESIKVLVTTAEDGSRTGSVESDWADSPGYQIQLADLVGLLGIHVTLDLRSAEFIQALADATGKPVFAVIDGVDIDPVQPTPTLSM